MVKLNKKQEQVIGKKMTKNYSNKNCEKFRPKMRENRLENSEKMTKKYIAKFLRLIFCMLHFFKYTF